MSSFETLLRATPGSRGAGPAVDAKGVNKSPRPTASSPDAIDLSAAELHESISFSPRKVIQDVKDVDPNLLFSDAAAFLPVPLPVPVPVPLPDQAPLPESFGQPVLDDGITLALNAIDAGPASQLQPLLAAADSGPASKISAAQGWLPVEKSDLTAADLVSASLAREAAPTLSWAADAFPAPGGDLPSDPLVPSARGTAPSANAAMPAVLAPAVLTAGVVQMSRSSAASAPLFEPLNPVAPLRASLGMPHPAGSATALRPDELKSASRLSAEPELFQGPAVTLAQFGSVSVRLMSSEGDREKQPLPLPETRQLAEGFGSWVPELGGVLSASEAASDAAAFAQQLAEKVDAWVGQRLQVAEIRLQEPNSDPVLVRIEMNGHQANVMFRTDVAACRDALMGQMDQLSDLLSAQGLQLGGASVGGSGADSSRRHNPSSNEAGWPVSKPAPAEPLIAVDKVSRRPLSHAGRALDIFV